MKLCYNSNGLRSISLLQAIEEVSKAGYQGIELSLHDNHFHPFITTEDYILEIKNAIESNNIEPVIIATGCDNLLSKDRFEPSLITQDKTGRETRIDLLFKTIGIAKILGCPAINFASGFLKNDNSPKTAKSNLIEGIKRCLEYSNDIILAIEPEPDMFIQTSDEAIEIIKEINHPNFKLNLDIGHVYCCEDQYLEKIEKALDYTYHIHIEDIKNKIHHHEIPGTGDIDFDSIISSCHKKAYQGFLSVELYHHSDVWQKALSESKEFILKKINEQVY